MFQHVSVLVSFIFAIALTHVFSSASQLLLARDRVRFSALLTVSMPYSEGGLLDMPAFFERQRRVIFSATLALSVMGGLATYADRNNFPGWKPTDWIGAELVGLSLAVFAVLAGWAKPRWLQWIGVGGMFVQNIWFFVFYTLGSQ